MIPPNLQTPKTERERQSLFACLLGMHLAWIYANGFEVTLADGYTLSGHMANSQHGQREAQDLNIFKAGRWMDGKNPSDAPDWERIGKAWETLHPLCRWGGRFKGLVDLNHFSIISSDGKRA